MSSIRRLFLSTVSGIALMACAASVARADVPVIDMAALGEWATSLANDATSYALQLQQEFTATELMIGSQLSWVKQAA
jgi:hypothetical protein